MSIHVTACLKPFSTDKTNFIFKQGISIKEIIRNIDPLHTVNTGWRVMIEDEIVTDFERMPEEGQHLYIKLVPEGDNKGAGTGMKIGGGLLTVIGAILLFTPASGLGAGLLGAGVGLLAGGITLYNIDIPTPGDREKPENDPSIRGSRNTPRPYGTVPTLLGRRRIYADPCANPYTWVDPADGSVYLYQLFCVGQKDLQIETQSFKIAETFLKDFSSTGNIENILNGTDSLIHMQIAYGETCAPLYNKCVHEIQLNTLLKHQTEEGLDGSIIRTTPDKTTEINVDVFAYNGLGMYNNEGGLGVVFVEIKAEYKLADAPDSDYQLLGYFYGGTNILFGNELKTKRFAVTKSNLTPAAYTVRLTRVSNDSSNSKVIDSIYVGSIRACKNEEPVRSEICQRTTLVGLKIKASEKLQSIVEQLNFVAQSRLPVYNTLNNSWTYNLSSNPASAAMYAMKGDFSQQKLSDPDIDMDAFKNLYLWCNEHQYECNVYLTDNMTIKDLLSAIASTCRAEILRINGKITVIQDIEHNSYVQLFTPRNSRDYKETVALSDIPDEMKMQFVDEESGFAENEVSVYNTPSGNKSSEPVTSQNIQLWGVTNRRQAQRLGMYKYAVSNHRFNLVKFSCDFEYLMCQKGDWIKYAGDIALAGLSQGRIAEQIVENGYVTGFECDEELPMEAGKSYAVRIRNSDGSMTLLNLRTIPGSSNTIRLENKILAAEAPRSGDLFAFGIRGNDSLDLIVTDIQCGENLTADLTCVEYAPEIFGVDTEEFILPDYESKLSEVEGIIDSGEVSNWKTWTTYSDNDNKPSKPSGSGNNNGWHYIQTEASKWISTKTAENINVGEWSEPIPTGQKIIELLELTDSIGCPNNINSLSAIAQKDSINLSWNPPDNNGLNNSTKRYIVEISRDSGHTWENLAVCTSNSYIYYFIRTNDRYPEAKILNSWRFRVLAENIYGKTSEWTITSVDTSTYGTWIPVIPELIKKDAGEGGILFEWNIPVGANNKKLYGNNTYQIKLYYDNNLRSTIDTDKPNAVYNFDRTVDGYPEKPSVVNASVKLNKYTFSIKVINESGNYRESTAQTIDYENYKTWIPHNLTGQYAPRANITKRAVTIMFPPQEDVYGSLQYGFTISRRLTDVTEEGGQTLQLFYTPNLEKDCYADIDSYKDSTSNPIFTPTTFKQNLPLLGQNMSSILVDRYDVVTEGGVTSPDHVASSREYYVCDNDGKAAFNNLYGDYFDFDEITGTPQSDSWILAGGTQTDYIERFATVKKISTPIPEATEYIYKIFARNDYGNGASETASINLTADANNVADLVDKAITVNKLDDQCVTTQKIAAGAITADEIAAVNILAKGAKAGTMTAEGIITENSGFWASKAMRYDYTDPDNVRKTYTAKPGEFFVGNNPAHETAPTDADEYLHFIPATSGHASQFFLAIKNILLKSLSTIVKGVFRVKNSLDDVDADSFMSVNPTNTDEAGVRKKTLNVNGKISLYGTDLLDIIYPIGSLYWTSKNPQQFDPNVEFGGTWQQVKDKFILAAGDTYGNGTTGGSAEKRFSISADNLPAHEHAGGGNISVSGSGTIKDGHTTTDGAHHHSYLYPLPAPPALDGFASTQAYSFALNSGNTTDDGAHCHSVTGSVSFSASGTDPTTGSNTTKHSDIKINTMPPYLVRYCWERIPTPEE